MASKFPFTIYVKEENDGGNKYLIATTDLAELAIMGETVKVAKYHRSEEFEVRGEAVQVVTKKA
jgi:hypothetical protein